MRNRVAKKILDDCLVELKNISQLLSGLGESANPTPYLKKYAVIRATGSIETAFKQTIADRVDHGSHDQVKNFIRIKVRDSSSNPKFTVIENLLMEFDPRWKARFSEQIALDDPFKLKSALTSLVHARNEFAHGGNPNLAIDETLSFFESGVRVIQILDSVINYNYESE